MGAWGHKPFENDGAGDFESELASDTSGTLNLFHDAFAAAQDDYLERDVGEVVIACAVIIAHLRGMPDLMLSMRALEWCAGHATLDVSELLPEAVTALDAVLLGPGESELFELWQETEDFVEWRNSVVALRNGLQAMI